MKNHFRLSLLTLLMAGALPVMAVSGGAGNNKKTVRTKKTTVQAATDTTPQTTDMFLYSPGDRHGFHVALPAADGKFTDIGQIFSSDYSWWGSEKRMYSPFISQLPEGGYAAVFQVNDVAPCFAVAWSEDLVTWRPQDYPRMSVGGCLAPMILREGEGRYSVLFATKDGSVRKTTTDASFRHFTADMAATSAETAGYRAVRRDTVTVGDKRFAGSLWSVSPEVADGVKSYFARMAENNRRNGEKLADDASLAEALGGKPLKAALTIDGKRQKDISDKLVGVFFEDISYAADGGLYAELVQNRDFEYTPADHNGWTATTAWRSSGGGLEVRTDNPLSKNNPHYVVLKTDTLYNTGWDGIRVTAVLLMTSVSVCATLAERQSVSPWHWWTAAGLLLQHALTPRVPTDSGTLTRLCSYLRQMQVVPS